MAGGDRPLVVGIGEALLRLEAPAAQRLERARELRVHVGGAELNALVLLRHLGCATRWVSRLPRSPLGRLTLSHVRAEGVEPLVSWSDARHGLYFLETGTPPRASEIVYDREASAASELGPQHVAPAEVIAGADTVHTTGITLGIGPSPRRLVTETFEQARRDDVRTSFDVNYRAKQWDRDEARCAVLDVLDHVDVLFASPFDLVELLRIAPDPLDAAEQLRRDHGCQAVVMPERHRHDDGREEIGVRVLSRAGVTHHAVTVRPVEPIGVGDAVVAGFLSTWGTGDPALATRRAAAAGAMKATVRGDALTATTDELDRELVQTYRVHR